MALQPPSLSYVVVGIVQRKVFGTWSWELDGSVLVECGGGTSVSLGVGQKFRHWLTCLKCRSVSFWSEGELYGRVIPTLVPTGMEHGWMEHG
jgi:hypothetical protein